MIHTSLKRDIVDILVYIVCRVSDKVADKSSWLTFLGTKRRFVIRDACILSDNEHERYQFLSEVRP